MCISLIEHAASPSAHTAHKFNVAGGMNLGNRIDRCGSGDNGMKLLPQAAFVDMTHQRLEPLRPLRVPGRRTVFQKKVVIDQTDCLQLNSSLLSNHKQDSSLPQRYNILLLAPQVGIFCHD